MLVVIAMVVMLTLVRPCDAMAPLAMSYINGAFPLVSGRTQSLGPMGDEVHTHHHSSLVRLSVFLITPICGKYT